jgi:hypothetical protein
MSALASWILIIWIYSPHRDPNVAGMAMVTVPSFNSQRDCAEASDMARNMVNGTDKEYRWACVPQNPSNPARAQEWKTR